MALGQNEAKKLKKWHRGRVLRGMRNPKTYTVGKEDMRKEMFGWYKQAGGKLTYEQAIKMKKGSK